MIQIHNLTKEQVETLEQMWAIKTEEELISWRGTQSKEKQRQITTLLMMIGLAYIDKEVEADKKLTLANKMLKKVIDL